MDLREYFAMLWDEQQWRENKMKSLRNQWGYDKEAGIKFQGDKSNPIYTDSLPMKLEDMYMMNNPMFANSLGRINAADEKWNNTIGDMPKGRVEQFELNQGLQQNKRDRDKLNSFGM